MSMNDKIFHEFEEDFCSSAYSALRDMCIAYQQICKSAVEISSHARWADIQSLNDEARELRFNLLQFSKEVLNLQDQYDKRSGMDELVYDLLGIE